MRNTLRPILRIMGVLNPADEPTPEELERERAEARARAAVRRERRKARRAERRARRLERRRRRAERGPAPRLTLGHWLPGILTAGFTTAIPAILISAELASDGVRRERLDALRSYLAAVRETGPDCAQRLAEDVCLCADFSSQSEALAYVAAQRDAFGRAPQGRVGLYTDDSETPCAYLPEK
ncbi:MAG: hypothetical protein AAGM38_13515 [Pseudomonadota bacterium]